MSVLITPKMECIFSGSTWTDISSDVLMAEPPEAHYGITGVGPLDLFASTGAMAFSMNNSEGNGGGLRGYYTPGHTNARSGWDIGKKTRLSFAYSGSTFYKFVGYITSITPTAGQYKERRADVNCVDWLDFAGTQKIQRLSIQENISSACAVGMLIGQAIIQPRSTCIGTAAEIFDRVFDSDNDAKTTVGAGIAKVLRNELGQGFIRGDLAGGETFEFAGRYARIGGMTTAASLNSSMTELEIEYDRQNVWNVVRSRTYPKQFDTSACVPIFSLQQPIQIGASSAQAFTAHFRDPGSARFISSSTIIYPFRAGTDYNLGSTCGAGIGDLNSSACFSASIGANTAAISVSNVGGTAGYLNDFNIFGRAIYSFDPVEYESRNEVSASLYGERVLDMDLDFHTTQVRGEPLAQYVRSLWDAPRRLIKSVRFLANKSNAAALAALQCEPGSRVYISEDMTGTAGSYDVNGVSYEIVSDRQLWVTWTVVAADTTEYFRVDHSLLDVDIIAP